MSSTWTLAYRRKTGPWFQRVANLELTWEQAFYAAISLGQVRPELQVWYTTTAAHEAREAARIVAGTLGANYSEDHGNILTDAGKRVPVRETGVLDPRVCVLPPHIAKAVWDAPRPGVVKY